MKHQIERFALGISRTEERMRLECEKTALFAQRKLLEKFVIMARSSARVEMMKKTLKKSVEVAAALTGADKGSLFLFDDEGDVTDSFLARGEPPAKEKSDIIRAVLTGGLAGWVRKYHRNGLVMDTEADNRWIKLPDQPYTARSALSIPILRGEELFGILTLLHPEADHFSRENAELMQLTANQMGLALENVRLYQKLDKSHRSLSEAKKAAESYSRALNAELEKGRKIQKDFLPSKIPCVPNWEIETCFLPAIQIAGDFYDVFTMPGGYIGLVVADVCDKGVGSALYMALLRSLIRIFSGQTKLSGLSIIPEVVITNGLRNCRKQPDTDQAQPLRAIPLTNHYLMQNHSTMGMFASIFFGMLDPDSGSLTYINAGHPSPLIVGAKGIKHRLDSTGPFVGLMQEVEFGIQSVRIEPEDMLIGYTDGVTEAISIDGAFFTRKRLEAATTQGSRSARDMISAIQQRLSVFTGNVPQSDDITILAVRRDIDN